MTHPALIQSLMWIILAAAVAVVTLLGATLTHFCRRKVTPQHIDR